MVFFERPEAFFLLPVFVLVILAAVIWEARKQTRAHVELYLSVQGIGRQIFSKGMLAVFALVLFSALLAQPKITGAIISVEVGGEVVLCFDNTESMDARKTVDSPSRLERSKRGALRILEDFHFIGVGICTLSETVRFPIPLSQITQDKQIVRVVVEDFIVSGAPLEEGTHVVGSLRDVAEVILEKYADSDQLPVVVALTDGEDTLTSGSIEEDIAYLKESGIPFALVGVGEAEGATIPRFRADGRPIGYYATYGGERYVSYLREEFLQNLAEQIGGEYFSEDEPGKLARFVRAHLPEIHRGREERGAKSISYALILPLILLVGIFMKKYIIS